MLQRARELLVQGANGTLSTGDEHRSTAELGQLGRRSTGCQHDPVQRAAAAERHLQRRRAADGNPLTLQVGPNANTVLIGGVTITYTLASRCRTLARSAPATTARPMNAVSAIMAGTILLAATNAGAAARRTRPTSALAAIDAAIDFISCFRGDLGAK